MGLLPGAVCGCRLLVTRQVLLRQVCWRGLAGAAALSLLKDGIWQVFWASGLNSVSTASSTTFPGPQIWGSIVVDVPAWPVLPHRVATYFLHFDHVFWSSPEPTEGLLDERRELPLPIGIRLSI